MVLAAAEAGRAIAQITAIVWCAIALVGFLVTVWTLQDARLDLEYVRRYAHAGTRLKLALAAVRRETLQAIIHATFLLAGVAAYMNPPSAQSDMTPTRIVISCCFIVAAILMDVNSWMDWRARKAVLDEITRQDEAKHREANERMHAQAESLRRERGEK